MRILISLDHVYTRTPDGAVWTGAMHDYAYWQPYREVFEEVHVVARAAPSPAPGTLRADGDGVVFHDLPDYAGALGFLRRRAQVVALLDRLVVPGQAVSVRVPSLVGYVLAKRVLRRGLPLAAEVVGDPWTYFAGGPGLNPLRPLMRRISAGNLQQVCDRSGCLCYVTASTLQRAYPPRPGALVESVLDIDLDDAWFAPRQPPSDGGLPQVVVVGNFQTLNKGQDLLIRALPELSRRGRPFRLMVVGEGRAEAELRSLAARLDVAGQVEFCGSAAGAAAVRARLDAAAVFCLPSRSEGLPRSLVEAMARGLPCIGTAVGGMPELLPAEDLVAVDDLPALAARLAAFLGSAELRAASGERNRQTALAFHRDRIAAKRRRFLLAVRAAAAG